MTASHLGTGDDPGNVLRAVAPGRAASGFALHRTIIVVDVEGFGDRQRTLPHQLGIRAVLYRAIAEALSAAGVRWEDCYHEDRGDSVFVLVPPELPKGPMVEAVPAVLARALRDHNEASPPEQRVRLRMAVHAGEVAFDDQGATSTALTTTFRLLNGTPVKQALADSPGTLALIVSRWIFDEVVRHSAVLDPAAFRPVPIVVKETRDTAWIALPDHPFPSDPTVLSQTPGDPARLDATSPVSAVVPRQLPAVPMPFVGRHAELDRLDAALNAARQAATVLISAIGGAGGIGKTWLALHWAHRHADRFLDGHLFVDLRGFSPDSEPMNPAAAVRGFLGALGVAPDRIPVELHAQTALFRSLIAGRRMLLVLDNAVDTTQVTPLLPGSESCAVMVTSRNRLPGLITGHGAQHLPLDVLPDTEARLLLTDRLGADRVDAEPAAVEELIRLCGGFPLALGLIAGHAHVQSHLPLEVLAVELRDLGLDALDGNDPTASLPTVLSWSLRSLTTEQRTVFALLGIAPGLDIGLPAAANLAGLAPARTKRVLAALEEASLLDHDRHGRWRMHDLIRAYAATTAHKLDEDTRGSALRRLLDFYTHTAYAALTLIWPNRPPLELAPPAPSIYPHSLPDAAAAMAWLDIEYTCLLAAQRTATIRHWHHLVWWLATCLVPFHSRRGHSHSRLAVWQAALDAAAHLPDPTTRFLAHRNLSDVYAKLGDHEKATEHLDQALALTKHRPDPLHQAHTHQMLTWVWERRGDTRRALEHAIHALTLFRDLPHPEWEADALYDVSWFAARLGEYDAAREHCRAAITLYQQRQLPEGRAAALANLGYIDYNSGHHDQAIDHYRQSLALWRHLGNTSEIANNSDGLGHPYATLGQTGQARTVWREALKLYQEQGRDEDAARVQRQLDNLDAHDNGDQPPPAAESAK